jgi:phosphohistidine phosphatase SixA
VAVGVESGRERSPAAMGVSVLYVVRHAHAGDRASWTAPDELRPLSEKGWAQARGLVEQMAHDRVEALFSSPALRCVQTVLPLAEARGLPVGPDDRLLEGHDPKDTLAWLEGQLAAGSLVASTHGDIIPGVLDLVAAAGGSLPDERRWAKGSTWVLERTGTRWGRGAYRKPPG